MYYRRIGVASPESDKLVVGLGTVVMGTWQDLKRNLEGIPTALFISSKVEKHPQSALNLGVGQLPSLTGL